MRTLEAREEGGSLRSGGFALHCIIVEKVVEFEPLDELKVPQLRM
jgi:hypothetical protein